MSEGMSGVRHFLAVTHTNTCGYIQLSLFSIIQSPTPNLGHDWIGLFELIQ